jgi:glycosyltransferase involved in cell wall biosynthesis
MLASPLYLKAVAPFDPFDLFGPEALLASRMKILCVTSIFPNRLQPNKGIYNWRHFVQLQKHADLRVISPVLWTEDGGALRRGKRPLASGRWTEWNGVPVVYPRFYYPPRFWRSSYGACLAMSIGRIFRQAVTDFRPEIVYACWAFADGWAAWRLARRHSLPVAVKVHGSDLLLLHENPGRTAPTVEMLKNVDAVAAVSEDLRNCAVKLGTPAHRAHLIYEGTDRELFSPGDRTAARRALGLDPAGSRILFVGNLVPVKAVPNLIEACRRLLAEGIELDADLVGDGPLRAALARQIADAGLSDRVHLRGAILQSELPRWYQAADLVVLGSHSEGVPNVLVEAAACGIPFVATNVGGIPEIAHLSPIPLVSPDDPAALARAIELALRKPIATTASVDAAAVPSVAACAETTLDVFAQVLSNRRVKTRIAEPPPMPAEVGA